jgi:glycosyltransferase involved in cell wall biosynthesis
MPSPMRIVLGTVYPYDESQVRGGVEAAALSLADALAKHDDLDLHVVSCQGNLKRSFSERRGRATFHWLATGRHFNGIRAATLSPWRLKKIYEHINPDIIHAQGFSEYALAAPANIPMVLTIHGVELFVPAMRKAGRFRGSVGIYRRWIESRIFRRSLARACAVISIAGRYVPQVMGKLLDGKPVYEIANPVDVGAWEAGPKAHDLDDRILCVGEINEAKNTLGLVRAFAEVAGQRPSATLFLAGGIGDPGYFKQVRREATRLGLQGKVTFCGRLDQSQLKSAYARASLVVLASIQETAPMALAQAMAAGKPVVATKAGGIPWMVEDGKTGILVDLGDLQALAERIINLLQDRVLREKMGRAAREAAQQRFSSEKVAHQTIQAYRNLLLKKE